MLELASVSYRYAGARRPALRDVDIRLADGEVVGVVGASEAGKTTLCLVASGLAPRAIGGQLAGRLLIDEVDAAPLPMHTMAERVGIAFANPATQLSGVTDTVFEEVAFGPMNLGMPRDELIDRTWSALEALGIAALAERHPARLSGGQQQLVALAGLLTLRPRHLVLDEPTAQLDPAGSQLVADALVRLTAGGTSILIAEQKTDILRRVCDRIVLLMDGEVAIDRPAAEALSDPRLPEAGVAAPAAVRLATAAREAGLPRQSADRLAAALAEEDGTGTPT